VGSSLSIDQLVDDRCVRLVFRGEVEVFTAPQVVEAFDLALQDRPAWLVLDLSDVTFADSTGVAALIRCRRKAAAANVEMSLACGDGPVGRLLNATGLAQVFSLV
jgi:anti-sigma B factor antagonist